MCCNVNIRRVRYLNRMSNCNKVYRIEVISIEVKSFVICVNSTKKSRREIDRDIDYTFIGNNVRVKRAA